MSTDKIKVHEGNVIKNYLKGSGKPIGDIAEALVMSRQNLNKHLQKEELGADFIKLLVDKLKIDAKRIIEQGSIIPPFRNEAFPIGSWHYSDATETTKGGNKYIDQGAGHYTLFTPLVPIKAQAGYLNGYGDEEYREALPKRAVPVTEIPKGRYVSFEVYGDSMDDGTGRKISQGDVVTGRLISPDLYASSKLHLNKFDEWIIVHNDGILIKQIIAHDVEKGIITIHSYNEDKKEYPDRPIYLSDVRELYNVVKVTRDRKVPTYFSKDMPDNIKEIPENKNEPKITKDQENILSSDPHKTGDDMDSLKSALNAMARADEIRARAELIRENNYAALIEQIREGSLSQVK